MGVYIKTIRNITKILIKAIGNLHIVRENFTVFNQCDFLPHEILIKKVIVRNYSYSERQSWGYFL